MCDSDHKNLEGCHCRGGLLRGFIQPHILLQLARQPVHGYELMDGLERTGGLASSDPGNLYRILRSLEEEGLVISKWDTTGPGAARRVYELTEDGHANLVAWVANLHETREKLDVFLKDYEKFSKIERKEKNGT